MMNPHISAFSFNKYQRFINLISSVSSCIFFFFWNIFKQIPDISCNYTHKYVSMLFLIIKEFKKITTPLTWP